MIMTTQRVENWSELLDKYFEDKALTKFSWGTHDCATFASGAVIEMTGMDPMADGLRGYTTRYGAFKLLRNKYNVGFLNTFIKVFDLMGFEEVDDLQYGDIVFARIWMEDKEEETKLGGVVMAVVYNDTGLLIAPGDDGLILFEDYELVRAWRL